MALVLETVKVAAAPCSGVSPARKAASIRARVSVSLSGAKGGYPCVIDTGLNETILSQRRNEARTEAGLVEVSQCAEGFLGSPRGLLVGGFCFPSAPGCASFCAHLRDLQAGKSGPRSLMGLGGGSNHRCQGSRSPGLSGLRSKSEL